MPTDQPTRSVWPTIFAGVMLLVVGYGAAYWWLVEPEGFGSTPYSTIVEVRPKYPHHVLDYLFAPANWLDRRIRPHVWGSTP